MTDERAQEIADKLRTAVPGARRDVTDTDIAQLVGKLYDEVQALKEQQRLGFGLGSILRQGQ